MDISTLENWLWDAACSIRGPIDAPNFKDYILPLLFYKRLCDVYEDEIGKRSKEFAKGRPKNYLTEECTITSEISGFNLQQLPEHDSKRGPKMPKN